MIPAPAAAARCEEISDRISEFLDGELPPEVEASVARHLSTCAGCATFTVELAATVQALHRLASRRAAPPGAVAGGR